VSGFIVITVPAHSRPFLYQAEWLCLFAWNKKMSLMEKKQEVIKVNQPFSQYGYPNGLSGARS
jgi:hypothetical protein